MGPDSLTTEYGYPMATHNTAPGAYHMAKKRAPEKPAPKPAPKSTAAATPPSVQENAEEMAEPKELSSSMVATIAYSEGELEVLFQSGSEENYRVTEAQFKELKDAPSPGKWMWQHFAPHGIGV